MGVEWLQLCVGLALLSTISVVSGVEEPSATVEQGRLRGYKLKTVGGKTIFAFSGVPYAKPPLGELRFKEPQPAEPWEGLRSAKQAGSACIQKDILFQQDPQVVGSEDCLYLNVFTTKLARAGDNVTAALPVMFWIHGGGWLSGQGDLYGPEYLLDRGVVLVTSNYRLGPLGFLSTEDAECPGNWGLKDQLAALRWVQKNIASFGGDPHRVTIFGQSAGGASVNYHLLSPLSKGTFQRAISMSGTAFAPWAGARSPGHVARRLAGLLACPAEPSAALVACLRGKDAALLVGAIERFLEWNVDPLLVFSPSVEPSGQGLVPATPLALAREAARSDHEVPWMAGLTAQDGAIRTAVLAANDAVLLSELDGDFEKLAPITLRFAETASDPKQTARKIRDFYFADKPIGVSTIPQVTLMYNDRHFLAPISEAVTAMRSFGSERPIFLYQVSHRGRHSIGPLLHPGSSRDYGVVHLDELQFLFRLPAFFPAVPADPADPDHRMMQLMTQLFANFASGGKPTEQDKESPPGSAKDDFVWSEATKEALWFADLRPDSPRMLDGLHERGAAFWAGLSLAENARAGEGPKHSEL